MQGLTQLGAAESLLTEEQWDVLQSGDDAMASGPYAFARAALENLLARIELAEAGLDETGSGA